MLFINNTYINAFTSTIAVITNFFDDHLTANPNEEVVVPDAGTGDVDKPGEGTEEDSDAGEKETVITNKGNEIDITPNKNHLTTTNNPGPEGVPNTNVDILDKNGQIKTRHWYNSDGHAYRDVDMTNHGNPAKHPEWPHEHFWDWSTNPPSRS